METTEKIAKTAKISPHATIGENVIIDDFCVIGDGVRIGEGTRLYNGVTILGNTTIGKNNSIFPYAVLGTIPQDLKYHGEEVFLEIGDHNIIREHCMFNPGTEGGGGKTIIGSHNLFMAYVHIAHDCIIGNHCIFANNATLGGHIEVGDHVNFGGICAVHQFAKIGDGVMVGGGSMLSQDVPPYCIAEGNRAVIRGLNRHRMRQLLSREDIDFVNALYRRLFCGSDLVGNLAKKELEQHPSHPLVKKICEFILHSERGIPLRKGGVNE
ncbi:acyl-ACP--UDP-N-acetylglucosamine O-acyltransferase [Helicobacter mustelae]|uniref:Putative UDP-N-acetylglucosamine acyltransferase n=1 Tax=Helicobacter mustelae (strain ATCC 43772 / CCUG 25715 / CIP 103759 / LMG 18044 / NCTC 12198 / R85-136P) TaxID=679897 RepID=D3UFN8_HELM1|nr:acyl-ACP--UDP-N-acetylglucosamine O-acyltransferase [Helicobacter mustelae]CBG39309.1 Putative UDP-N-acetylglucosamine acyltransferase [Helicobacter mustelae 12198]SQH70821.1 UDP-N-acetylglucosamine acyltransferase [Helicobacter mustelae]